MITGERNISVAVRIFTTNLQDMNATAEHIRQDFESVVKHYESENNDEIQVHLVQPQKCSYCHKPFPECQCGKPFPRPAV